MKYPDAEIGFALLRYGGTFIHPCRQVGDYGVIFSEFQLVYLQRIVAMKLHQELNRMSTLESQSVKGKTTLDTWLFPAPGEPGKRQDRDKWRLVLEANVTNRPVLDACKLIYFGASPDESLLNAAQREKVKHIKQCWVYTFLWVIQNETNLWSRQDWPFSEWYLRAYESYAKPDFIELKMCQWLHNYLPREEAPGGSPFAYWREIITQDYVDSFKSAIPAPGQGNPPKPPGKRVVQHNLAHIQKCLREMENPWNEAEEPLKWNLLELVRGILSSERDLNRTRKRQVRKLRELWTEYRLAFRELKEQLKGERLSEDGRFRFGMARTYISGNRLLKTQYSRPDKQIFPEKKDIKLSHRSQFLRKTP